MIVITRRSRRLELPTLNSITGFTRLNGSASPAMSSGVASVSGTTDGVYGARWDTPMLSDYMFAEVTCASAPAASRQSGVFVRCDNSGTISQRVAFGAASGNVYIFTFTTGSNAGTQRATSTATVNNGSVLRLECHGNVYTGYVDGVLKVTWTDSGNIETIGETKRSSGLFVVRQSFGNSCNLSNLKMGDL